MLDPTISSWFNRRGPKCAFLASSHVRWGCCFKNYSENHCCRTLNRTSNNNFWLACIYITFSNLYILLLRWEKILRSPLGKEPHNSTCMRKNTEIWWKINGLKLKPWLSKTGNISYLTIHALILLGNLNPHKNVMKMRNILDPTKENIQLQFRALKWRWHSEVSWGLWAKSQVPKQRQEKIENTYSSMTACILIWTNTGENDFLVLWLFMSILWKHFSNFFDHDL